MPITPLHMGVLAPINHYFPKKVSNISFALVTLWADGNAILYYAFGLEPPGELHGMTHTFAGAMALALVVGLVGALCGAKKWPWILGAFLAGITHVLLDALVHPEMNPLFPIAGNSMYIGNMPMVSLALLPFCIWLTLQYVSYSRVWLQKHLGETADENS